MATLSSRRRPKGSETFAAAAVLCTLFAVTVWVLVRQANPSPAVTIDFLASAAGAGTAGHGKAASSAPPGDLLATWPEGLKPLGPAERFSPMTLSDKINGKAELYLPAGFVALHCQRLAPGANPEAWFEAFIYDMGRPDQAYSVYSSQKRSVTQEARAGDFSYRAANQLCFVHGHYYVEVVAAAEGAAMMQATDDFAAAFVAATPVQERTTAVHDAARFPRDRQLPNSVMLLSADVFGFDRLSNVFVARYRDGNEQVTLFLSRRTDPAEAAGMAAALGEFFIDECGGRAISAPDASGATVIDVGGVFEGIFSSGVFLAGVHEAPSEDAAVRWLDRLRQSLTARP